MGDSSLRQGDVVWVRSASEILATLDATGALDELPFMPEMIPFCGRRFVVACPRRSCVTPSATS